jgi:putative ABC transport system permease protein
VLALPLSRVAILNSMLVTARGQTLEISIRTALGARGRQVLETLLLGSRVIRLAGGPVGILIGTGIPVLLTSLLEIEIPISLNSVALRLGLAAGVGILFECYPLACRAARARPSPSLQVTPSEGATLQIRQGTRAGRHLFTFNARIKLSP